MEFNQIKERIEKDSITRDMLKLKLKDLNKSKKSLETESINSEKAREIFQLVSQKTMSNLELHMSNLVTLALKSVNPDFPEFVARITLRRNQTEVDFLFKEFDREQKPMDSSGYGAVNIAAYALRVAFWSLGNSRNTLILDEPFPDLSPDLQEKAGEMVKMISDKLGLQQILVSHAEDINYKADKTFTVMKKGKQSFVKEEK